MLPAYWISNYIIDTIKILALSVIAIIFIYIYEVSVDYAWLALLLYPFAVVPYTYFFSFLFPSEDSGEKFALIHNFVLGGIIALAVFILRIISSTREVGIAFFWVLKFLPMYCLCEAIIDSASISLLGTAFAKPTKVYSTAMEIDVSGSAIIFLFLQAIFYPILVFLVEIGAFTFCFKYIK
ncbi:MAG: ABC transporter permease [Streptococcus sp.]|nr:ABC transporter permease [Streptococcus sp.]